MPRIQQWTWEIGYSSKGIDNKYTEMKVFFKGPSSDLPMIILKYVSINQ